MFAKLSRNTCFLILISILLLLPGCWSGHELTDRLIVLGISLDSVNGKIRLTLQGILPESFISSTSTPSSPTGGDQSTFSLLSADGNSVQDAIQKIDKITPRFLYFGHNAVFFIGEDLAKKGLMPYLDFFARNQWGQESAWIIIAKGGTGQKLLTTTNLLVRYPAMGLEELVRKHQTQIPTLFKFLLNYHSDSGSQILVNAIDLKNTDAPAGFQIDQLLLGTSALFQKDKLTGYLDDLDGQTYEWLKNGFQNSRFSFTQVPDPGAPLLSVMLSGDPAVFQVMTSPKLNVRLQVTCDFNVTETSTSHLSSPADIRALENRLDDVLTQRFDQLMTHLQENKADVFNIAEKVHAYHLRSWQEVQDHWPDVYAGLPIEIVVNSHFRNSSAMDKYPGLKE
ncbi:Ger(x)C family spore germination protein [Desulfosporosinus sp. PR]|uniref:Ger(x)C family spore germination protein n=1 Tax=Candidatus Desulfosporosinus nitrosoreducens TaxID=3401928 RepID=UPI0027E8DC04|nr:Ger(x)C family spore germination protein [Desulfosporosinus sp. PR]MDQ7095198.1 Ger(x)C family spore germination protein [Desulfosporosinus sp. PR]